MKTLENLGVNGNISGKLEETHYTRIIWRCQAIFDETTRLDSEDFFYDEDRRLLIKQLKRLLDHQTSIFDFLLWRSGTI